MSFKKSGSKILKFAIEKHFIDYYYYVYEICKQTDSAIIILNKPFFVQY